MAVPLFLLTLIAMVALVYAIVVATAYSRMRGVRVVVCPETRQPAAITISATKAAISAVCEQPDLHVRTCSRWPDRKACNEACTAQVAAAPRDTLAFSIAKRWYAGKRCALCLEPIAPLPRSGTQPGLLNRALRQPPDTITWRDVPAQELPAVLSTYLAVCARCHMREQFGARATASRNSRRAGAGAL
jgi:hypothetical protein